MHIASWLCWILKCVKKLQLQASKVLVFWVVGHQCHINNIQVCMFTIMFDGCYLNGGNWRSDQYFLKKGLWTKYGCLSSSGFGLLSVRYSPVQFLIPWSVRSQHGGTTVVYLDGYYWSCYFSVVKAHRPLPSCLVIRSSDLQELDWWCYRRDKKVPAGC